ncbi:MAG: class I SAM-dependent methyltransferase [Alphaproteobacteria bacterium]|nr:class I SAM-dependent methyltransferase [Alphaproteobacteria bacterium]
MTSGLPPYPYFRPTDEHFVDLPMTRAKINYGLDAPAICYGMFGIGIFGMLVSILSSVFLAGYLLLALEIVAVMATAYGLGMGSYMVWSSRIGKLRTCEILMNQIDNVRKWNGDETVLDVGCGRGLLVIGAAKRLKSGKSFGIDIWKSEDQSKNSPDAAIENAEIAGVADRVQIRTGDARQIPFADQSFDIVVSHWVIHNIDERQDRRDALQEIWRVLKSDGVLALADISFVPDYMKEIENWKPKSIHFNDGGLDAKIMGILSGGTYCPQYLIVRK